jgi:putative membrane protein insertion efficiency factor
MKKIIILLIGFYQKYISPLKPATCRFCPTCSEYATQALEKYGLLKGLWLSIRRISRCHPFNPGGYDPLPDFLGACSHKK